jgi:hypothetical protein
MQVFGLPRHIIRSGQLASRIAVQSQITKPRSAGPQSAAGGKRWPMG